MNGRIIDQAQWQAFLECFVRGEICPQFPNRVQETAFERDAVFCFKWQFNDVCKRS